MWHHARLRLPRPPLRLHRPRPRLSNLHSHRLHAPCPRQRQTLGLGPTTSPFRFTTTAAPQRRSRSMACNFVKGGVTGATPASASRPNNCAQTGTIRRIPGAGAGCRSGNRMRRGSTSAARLGVRSTSLRADGVSSRGSASLPGSRGWIVVMAIISRLCIVHSGELGTWVVCAYWFVTRTWPLRLVTSYNGL